MMDELELTSSLDRVGLNLAITSRFTIECCIVHDQIIVRRQRADVDLDHGSVGAQTVRDGFQRIGERFLAVQRGLVVDYGWMGHGGS